MGFATLNPSYNERFHGRGPLHIVGARLLEMRRHGLRGEAVAFGKEPHRFNLLVGLDVRQAGGQIGIQGDELGGRQLRCS